MVRITFDGVAGLILAPVTEDFVLYPGHVFGVGFIVLFLGPLGHGCGDWEDEAVIVFSEMRGRWE